VSFADITHCVASQRMFIAVLFRYGLNPETFGYTIVNLNINIIHITVLLTA
jgi:hypothetical protein